MKVKDIMRTEFISFQRDDKLLHILQTFSKNRITSAPVFDDKEYIGIVDSNVIVKFFMPKHFLFLWKRDSPIPLNRLRKIIAMDMVVKPNITLDEDDDLRNVLDKIAGELDCIPVFDKSKKLVGIVRNDDVIKLVLRKFASGRYIEPEGKPVHENRRVCTDIDKVYDVVKKHDWISAKDISRQLGISVKTVEKMGEVLQDHHLVTMRYTFFGGALLGRVGHERKGPEKKGKIGGGKK